ncbi:uncharacterized protein LOC129286335 [Prosopis cineraria]|uniref:uncharacterized protein LOC129286335 n=1 Tax=Prosopis cineraria TaxID=364024 RepID=UPI0024109F0A|nr:uncharacterized protein LOC129286335 [Prosopis cineraria]
MKIALPALFFLLFVFSTQHQTLNLAEDVLDITGNPVVSVKLYHILSAANTSSGVELDQIDANYCCPVSLVLGIDPKFVYFAVAGSEETGENITTDNAVTISFANPPICATSPNVSVKIREHG